MTAICPKRALSAASSQASFHCSSAYLVIFVSVTAERWLETFNLLARDVSDVHVQNPSFNQLQKITDVLSFVHPFSVNPDVVVHDEVVGDGDIYTSSTQANVMEKSRHLWLTSFITSHDADASPVAQSQYT